MRPAFSSSKEAALFILLLLLLLAGPLWLVKPLEAPREQMYAAQGWRWGPYPWIHDQIFKETNAIDIAFVGSSHMMWAIDTPYVQDEANKRFGPNRVVRSVTWGGPDFDCLYLICKDLLEHRKVKMLVFYDESQGPARNAMVPALFRYADDGHALRGLSWRDKIPFYFAADVGLPQNLLWLCRPNIPSDPSATNSFEERSDCPSVASRLGSVCSRHGFRTSANDAEPFVPYIPSTKTRPADASVYSSATETNFQFLHLSLPDWQTHFAQKFGELARQHGCQLVLLHIPTFADRHRDHIQESEYWPDVVGTNVAMIGVPPEKFFAGMTENDCKKLFGDPGHLNQNGQRYFTPLVTPALLKIYQGL